MNRKNFLFWLISPLLFGWQSKQKNFNADITNLNYEPSDLTGFECGGWYSDGRLHWWKEIPQE